LEEAKGHEMIAISKQYRFGSTKSIGKEGCRITISSSDFA
jgi:hypothetical protein